MPGLWTCPDCHVQFASANQWHSCLREELTTHFTNRPGQFVLIFDAILQVGEGEGPFRIRSVPSAIIFKKRSSFADLHTSLNCGLKTTLIRRYSSTCVMPMH